jgi:hypothetical protein
MIHAGYHQPRPAAMRLTASSHQLATMAPPARAPPATWLAPCRPHRGAAPQLRLVVGRYAATAARYAAQVWDTRPKLLYETQGGDGLTAYAYCRVGPLHRETAWLGVGLRAD